MASGPNSSRCGVVGGGGAVPEPGRDGVRTPRDRAAPIRGFYAFPFFDWFTDHGCWFVTRARDVAAVDVAAGLTDAPRVRDRVIAVGAHHSNPCAHPVRLVAVQIAPPGTTT